MNSSTSSRCIILYPGAAQGATSVQFHTIYNMISCRAIAAYLGLHKLNSMFAHAGEYNSLHIPC